MATVKKSSHQLTIWKRQMPSLTQPSVSWKSSLTLTLKFQSSCLVTVDVTVFPVQENIHRNNILSKAIVPARISDSLAEKAKAMAVKIAEQLNLSGTLCVEMFATADDIIVNEYTTSTQFRALLN